MCSQRSASHEGSRLRMVNAGHRPSRERQAHNRPRPALLAIPGSRYSSISQDRAPPLRAMRSSVTADTIADAASKIAVDTLCSESLKVSRAAHCRTTQLSRPLLHAAVAERPAAQWPDSLGYLPLRSNVLPQDLRTGLEPRKLRSEARSRHALSRHVIGDVGKEEYVIVHLVKVRG